MEEFEKQLRKFKALVFWFGLVVVAGSNSTGFYNLLYPESVQRVIKEKIVTKDYLNEYIGNHDQKVLISAENMVEDKMDKLRLHMDSLNHECVTLRREDRKDIEGIRLIQHGLQIRIDECIRRTQ